MIPWQSKPPIGTQVDPSHPSAVGLLDYFPGWEAIGTTLRSIGPRRMSFTFGANNSWASAPTDEPHVGVGVTGTGTSSILTTTDAYYNAWTQTQPWSVGFFYTPSGTLNATVWTNVDATISYRGIEVSIDSAGKVAAYVVWSWADNALHQLSTTAMSLGTTYHVIVTYDGTRGTGSVKMYLNGVADSMPSPAVNTLASTPSIASSTKMQIGTRPGGTTGIGSGKRISDLAIWGRAMPAAEAIAFQANPFAWFRPTVTFEQIASVYSAANTYSESGGGGIRAGSVWAMSASFYPASSGGAKPGSAPSVSYIASATASSGAAVGASPTPSLVNSRVASGGVASGGPSTPSLVSTYTAKSGVASGSTSANQVSFSPASAAGVSGGTVASNTSSTTVYASAGAIIGGYTQYGNVTTLAASSGLRVGLTSSFYATRNPGASGGVGVGMVAATSVKHPSGVHIVMFLNSGVL
jgi:hypothetical protein